MLLYRLQRDVHIRPDRYDTDVSHFFVVSSKTLTDSCALEERGKERGAARRRLPHTSLCGLGSSPAAIPALRCADELVY